MVSATLGICTASRPVAVTYSLSVVRADGCPSLADAKVTVIVRSPFKVFAGDNMAVALGQSVPLSAVDVQGVGFSAFEWTPATGLSDPNVADPLASPGAVGTVSIHELKYFSVFDRRGRQVFMTTNIGAGWDVWCA